MTSTDTFTTVVVPGPHLMSALLGPRDQHLRQIELQFPETDVAVRGNEISVRGGDTIQVGRLFEELVGLLEHGHELDERTIERSIGMVRSDERPTEVLTRPGVARRQGAQRAAQDGRSEALRRCDSRQHHHVRHRAGRDRQVWLAVAMAVQALQAKQVKRIILTRPAVEAGERLGLPPRRPDGQDRSLSASAVRRAVRHGRSRRCRQS